MLVAQNQNKSAFIPAGVRAALRLPVFSESDWSVTPRLLACLLASLLAPLALSYDLRPSGSGRAAGSEKWEKKVGTATLLAN